jgi:hypothetical protein
MIEECDNTMIRPTKEVVSQDVTMKSLLLEKTIYEDRSLDHLFGVEVGIVEFVLGTTVGEITGVRIDVLIHMAYRKRTSQLHVEMELERHQLTELLSATLISVQNGIINCESLELNCGIT